MARLNRENYVFRRNPKFEHMGPAIDWGDVRHVARALPGVYRSTLTHMKRGESWEDELFLFYKLFCDASISSFGVPSAMVVVEFDLDLPRNVGGSEGSQFNLGESQYLILLSKLKFADVKIADAWYDKETDIESIVIPTGMKEQSVHLANMLVYWSHTLLHEMYHVRQSDHTVTYAQRTSSASNGYLPSRPERYDRDLGERSATAVGIRGLLEMSDALNPYRRSLPIVLDLALEDMIHAQQEMLAERSEPLPTGDVSWRGDIFKPAKRKMTAREKKTAAEKSNNNRHF